MGDAPLQNASLMELLQLFAGIQRELRARGVSRTANNPVADYAEYLVAEALGLQRAPNSEKGFDAVAPDGTRYEIKSRRLGSNSKPTRFSAIRKLEEYHFDYVVAILFNEDFGVSRAVSLPHSAVTRLAFWQEHVNGWILPVHDTLWLDSEARDLTHLLRERQAE